jgi:Rne/Rng family ribonuclease
MSKELFVTSTPHETKIAVTEDDQLVEIFFERENEYTLAGSIYKGKVTRVLPGMQSAFVEVGLERDAFLYVTDFLEEVEEESEEGPAPSQSTSGGRQEGRERGRRGRGRREEAAPPRERPEGQPAEAQAEGQPSADAEPGNEADQADGGARRWRGRRGRRRGRGNYRRDREQNETASAESTERSATDADAAPFDAAEELPHVTPEYEISGGFDAEDEPSPERSGEPSAERFSEHSMQSLEPQAEAESSERGGWNERPQREERQSRDRGGRDRGGRNRDDRGGRDRDERGERDRAVEGSSAPSTPIVLPGESLAKFGRKVESDTAHTGESAHQPKGRFTKPAPRPSTEVTDPSAFLKAGKGVLAGETIAKYRGRPREEAVEHHREHKDEYQQHQAHAAAQQSHTSIEDVVVPQPAVAPDEHFSTEREPEPMQPAAARAQEHAHATTEAESEEAHQHDAVEASPYGQGVVEEEEISEEEHDYESEEDDLDESEFEELEEETLEEDRKEQDMIAAGEGLAKAMAESRQDVEGSYMEQDLAEEDEFDEAANGEGEAEEMGEAEGEEISEADEAEEAAYAAPDTEHPDYEGRAEMRAPAGTAAFQQRTAEPERGSQRRDGRGRTGRGRTGGPGRRPMRSRRNIPRGPLPQINELLKEGQEILVQIAKEPIAKKGARITSHIALPGRFLVFMPTVNHTGVSRKIGSEEERQRLKRLLIAEKGSAHGGFIVRTAAAGASDDDLRADIRFLINLWSEIKGRSESSKAPALIYHDLNLVERILRDQVTDSFSHIWVDSEQEYERILRFASRFQPNLVKRVKLYSKETPLFEQFNIQEEINKALKSKVWLKSGGYIVINQTEALVAIDINTGKYVGKTSRLEDTIVKTNIDAIKEIVRQIRLRDLGGIIVIDFIDMDERRNRQKVMQALEEALRNDRSPSKVLQFNDFGLVAITRKRVKQSLERTLSAQCTYCTGTGMIKSVATVCNEIFVEMRKMSRHLDQQQVMLRVNPEVAKALKENNARWLNEMEEVLKKTIIVKSDPAQHQEQFDIQ